MGVAGNGENSVEQVSDEGAWSMIAGVQCAVPSIKSFHGQEKQRPKWVVPSICNYQTFGICRKSTSIRLIHVFYLVGLRNFFMYWKPYERSKNVLADICENLPAHLLSFRKVSSEARWFFSSLLGISPGRTKVLRKTCHRKMSWPKINSFR